MPLISQAGSAAETYYKLLFIVDLSYGIYVKQLEAQCKL